MTIPTINFEAKKVSYKQAKDGIVVSFLVSLVDVPDALAVAPLGQRYVVVLAAVGDDESPIPPEQIVAAAKAKRKEPEPSSAETKAWRAEEARQRYAVSPEREKARVRAALLAKTPAFRKWIAGPPYFYGDTEAAAAEFIRQSCFIGSRAAIAHEQEAYERFLKLETTYQIETNMIEVR